MYFNSELTGTAQKTKVKNILACRTTQKSTVNGCNQLYGKNATNTT